MWTRRHFETIARDIRDTLADLQDEKERAGAVRLAQALRDTFQRANARFDVARFETAADMPDSPPLASYPEKGN